MAYIALLSEMEIKAFEKGCRTLDVKPDKYCDILMRRAMDHNLPPVIEKKITHCSSQPRFNLLMASEAMITKYLLTFDNKFYRYEDLLLTGLIRAGLYLDDCDYSGYSEDKLTLYIDEFFARSDKTPRPEQRVLIHRQVRQSMRGALSLHDASTGIGKTSSSLCSASFLLENSEFDYAIYAVPTVKLVNQVTEEAERFGISVTEFHSKSAYVSSYAIELALEDCPQYRLSLEAFKAWLEKHENYRLTQLPVNYTELVEIIPFNLLCTDSTPSDDAGMRQFNLAKQAMLPNGIVLMTHAMLAREFQSFLFTQDGIIDQCNDRTGSDVGFDVYNDLRRNGEVLNKSYAEWLFAEIRKESTKKPFNSKSRLAFLDTDSKPVLIIDEAHLYPSQVEMVLSDEVDVTKLNESLRNIAGYLTDDCKGNAISIGNAMLKLHEMSTDSNSDEIGEVLTSLTPTLSSNPLKMENKSDANHLRLCRCNANIDGVRRMASSRLYNLYLEKMDQGRSTIVGSTQSKFKTDLIMFASHFLVHSCIYMSGTLNDGTMNYRFSRQCSIRLDTTHSESY